MFELVDTFLINILWSIILKSCLKCMVNESMVRTVLIPAGVYSWFDEVIVHADNLKENSATRLDLESIDKDVYV